MLRESVGGLMDEVTDPEAVAELRRVISAHAEGAIEAHALRTRAVGRVTFVEFHLVVPGRMTVEDAHTICDRIERALRERVGEAVINIHVEPEHKAKAPGRGGADLKGGYGRGPTAAGEGHRVARHPPRRPRAGEDDPAPRDRASGRALDRGRAASGP